MGETGWMDDIVCVLKVELCGKGFKVSEDRTRAPYLFQGSGVLRAWGWLSRYTGPLKSSNNWFGDRGRVGQGVSPSPLTAVLYYRYTQQSPYRR